MHVMTGEFHYCGLHDCCRVSVHVLCSLYSQHALCAVCAPWGAAAGSAAHTPLAGRRPGAETESESGRGAGERKRIKEPTSDAARDVTRNGTYYLVQYARAN